MIVSIDLGYGYTKAISEKADNIIFPSIIAPAGNRISGIEEMTLTKHFVSIRSANKQQTTDYYVGEKAIQEGRAAQLSIKRDKHNSNMAMILLMTAAYLSGADGNIVLGYGVPLSYYKAQRKEIEKILKNKEVFISVNNGPEKLLRFSEVHIFPQGVGILFNDSKIATNSLIGIIDIGYYTTDYLLTETSKNGFTPLYNYMSSIEIGVHTAQKHFGSIMQSITGKAFSLVELHGIWNKEKIAFAGETINISEYKKEAVREAGQSLVESMIAAWSEKIDYLDVTILGGGGALEFLDVFRGNIKGTRLTHDPQFSNANGFYAMTKKKLEKLHSYHHHSSLTK